MRKILNIVLAVFVSASLSKAGILNSTRITGVYCGYFKGGGVGGTDGNMCSVYFEDQTNPSSSSCMAGQPFRMQFKLDDIGKGVLSIALTAYSTGAKVQAQGTGSCTVWRDTEDLSMLWILPPN